MKGSGCHFRGKTSNSAIKQSDSTGAPETPKIRKTRSRLSLLLIVGLFLFISVLRSSRATASTRRPVLPSDPDLGSLNTGIRGAEEVEERTALASEGNIDGSGNEPTGEDETGFKTKSHGSTESTPRKSTGSIDVEEGSGEEEQSGSTEAPRRNKTNPYAPCKF